MKTISQIFKEAKKITAHYYRSNIGARKPYDPLGGYLAEGILDHIAKKYHMNKGNRKH